MHKLVFFIFIIAIYAGCKYPVENNNNQNNSNAGTMQKRPIEQVMKDHTDEIMKIPGVQGFYMGELEDGRPCITVMVDKKTEENLSRIPKELEGYPVIIEETGKIRPLN